MADIFRKTDLGSAEIINRSQYLTPKLRRTLILIDGQRSAKDLVALIGEAEMLETISFLEDEGYIELSGSSSPDKKAVSHTQALGTRLDLTAAGGFIMSSNALRFIDRSGNLRRALSFEVRRARGAKALLDLLGDTAEPLATQITRADTEDRLKATLIEASRALESQTSPRAARRYRDHVRLNLPETFRPSVPG